MGIGKFLQSLEKEQAEDLILILEEILKQLKLNVNEQKQAGNTVPPADPPDPPKN